MKIIRNSFVIVAIFGLTLLATANKSLYEKIFSSWFDKCLIVIDTEFDYPEGTSKGKTAHAYVEIQAFGDVPESFDVQFNSKHPLKEVTLIHSRRNNLLLHNDVLKKCPISSETDYCKSITQEPGYYPELTWILRNFSSNINPVFQVDLTLTEDELDSDTFQTYVINSNGPESCRVEEAGWLNFWAWLDTGYILGLLLLVLVLITSLVQYFKKAIKEETD
jgi:hypothetical protein